MKTSEQINEIATALAKAQGAMSGAMKAAANPFFKSKYADLASVWEACREPLATNGIAVIQSPTVVDLRVSMDTLLVHTSGQWIENTLSCIIKDDSPQVIGSATTYLRRYALQSLVGVAAEDDDGEAAQGRTKPANGHAAKPEPVPPTGYAQWMDDLESAADEGEAALQVAWKASKPAFREWLPAGDKERLKAKATKVPA